jgi:hypothetical protein
VGGSPTDHRRARHRRELPAVGIRHRRIDEMATAQISIGFVLRWDIGPLPSAQHWAGLGHVPRGPTAHHCPKLAPGGPPGEGRNMRRRAEFDSLLKSQLQSGPVVRLLFRLRRSHPELAFEIDQISQALKAAAETIGQFDDELILPSDDDARARAVAP